MENSIIRLKKEFERIKEMKWVESKRSGTTGIGYTFEELLGKKENNYPYYDFEDIEIKVHNKKSNYPIHLFNATPDGDEVYPIKKIIDKIGYPDKLMPKYNVFNITVSGNNFTKIGYYKRVKLKVDYNNKKVYLIAINNNNENYDLNVSWSFKLLQEKIKNKIEKLAIIEAETKNISFKEYYKYNSIVFYKIKKFDYFINLIDKGIISITFKIGVFRSGPREGQIHDRGTDFSIYEKDINKLYDLIPSGAQNKKSFIHKLSNWFGSKV